MDIPKDMKLNPSLKDNINYMKNILEDCDDIVFREFYMGSERDIHALLLYTDNITNGREIEDAILTNLMIRGQEKFGNTHSHGSIITMIQDEIISIGEINQIDTFMEVFDAILLGDTIILVNNDNNALRISTKEWPHRGVSETQTEVVVQGPKDSFTEVGAVNTALVRRRIRDTNLKVKRQKLGQRSKTDVTIMYMQDIVKKEVLEETLSKLEDIEVDAVFDSGYVKNLMGKEWMSVFPRTQLTERPDKVSAAIMEGRIAIIIDNSPFVMLVPATLNVFFHAAEDYYDSWQIMSFLRILRYISAFVAVVLPGLYIALTVYHPGMIPTALAIKIAASRAQVPFPTVIEILIMEFAFELLREAGIRLPSPVSSTIGIVGGIIIGQAAVEAGIVGNTVVIISSIAGICSFAVPNVSLVSSIRLLKILMVALCAVLGLYGFWIGLLFIIIHLSSLKSFGIPYMFPFCSGEVNGFTDFKDSIIRLPLVAMKKRPIFANLRQKIRMDNKK